MLTLPCPDHATFLVLPGVLDVLGFRLIKRSWNPDTRIVVYSL
jgi:hypothetical protein